jgi:surface polysaccharide O-acyltransferase-like enzyme
MARDESIDLLKGLAMIAVIGLHIIPFFVNAENVSTERSRSLLVFMNYFRFAVPFFVSLSGLALARKYRGHPLNVIEFQ